jgi:hypothetical protein
MSGTAPMAMATTPGAMEDRTQLSAAFEGTALSLPSSYGNFHGIELSTGVRHAPFDFWLTFGTAVTVLSVGHGGPLTFRLGGGFGAGFDLAHGYGYVRGRAAIVVIPRRLDVEVSALWSPPSAGTGRFDERSLRVAAWYRLGKDDRALEVYVESFRRFDEGGMNEHTFDGAGGGIGVTLF